MVGTSSSARASGNGFSAEVNGTEARRQFRLSVGVVMVLAVGIVSAAVSVGSHPIAAKRDVVSMAPVVVQHAEARLAGDRAI